MKAYEEAKQKVDVYMTAIETIKRNKAELQRAGFCADPKCNLPMFYDDFNDRDLSAAINMLARIAKFPTSGKLVRELLIHMIDEQMKRNAALPWWRRLLRIK